MMTNEELLDTLVVDLNTLPKLLIDGNFIMFCGKISEMATKVVNLKKGFSADIQSKNKIIEQLKEQLRNAGAEVEDMKIDEFIEKYGKKDGAE